MKNVDHVYPHASTGLHDVSITIRERELVFLGGESGAGKTTLLKLIYGALAPTSGEVWVDEEPLHSASRRRLARIRRRLGFVFQDYGLLPGLTALENVCFAIQVTDVHVPFAAVRRRALDALDAVGLSARADGFPRQLSGGQQQRLAIARALVNRPRLLLADEPTGNLDDDNARRIGKLLEQVASQGTAVIVATHDSSLLMRGRRVVMLAGGSLVEQQGQSGAVCG
jgi:cell division transport system ATP-binding protein